MRLPRPAVPEGLAPPQRAIMEALAVRALGLGGLLLAGLRREQPGLLPAPLLRLPGPSTLVPHLPPPTTAPHSHPQGLVEACTRADPDDRPSISEVLCALRAAAGAAAEASAPPTPASTIVNFS